MLRQRSKGGILMIEEIFNQIDELGVNELENENMTIYFIQKEEVEAAANDVGKKIPWNNEWIIFGFDEETDDPIFLDKLTGNICTAYEFEGDWEKVILFKNIEELFNAYEL